MKAPKIVEQIVQITMDGDTARAEIIGELTRCKDCVYGHLYIDVQNGVTDSWIECRSPEGLNRDVSVDGYCSASIRRKADEG